MPTSRRISIETRLGRLDDSIRAKLKAGDVDALRAELLKFTDRANQVQGSR
jgi:hypothetical protein